MNMNPSLFGIMTCVGMRLRVRQESLVSKGVIRGAYIKSTREAYVNKTREFVVD